jgi:hypothetical protein
MAGAKAGSKTDAGASPNEPETNEALKTTVTGILNRPCLAKINFSLNGLLVTGARLAVVARAVNEAQIRCIVVSAFTAAGQPAKGNVIEAHYDTDTHAMQFERQNYGVTSISERATIVHEATHAMFDLCAPADNATQLSIDDEAAAALAAALYVRLCENGHTGGFGMEIDGPEGQALKLADVIISETTGQEGKLTYVLTPVQTQDLRAAVAAKYMFIQYVDDDGRPTDNSGHVYTYRRKVKPGPPPRPKIITIQPPR